MSEIRRKGDIFYHQFNVLYRNSLIGTCNIKTGNIFEFTRNFTSVDKCYPIKTVNKIFWVDVDFVKI